MLLNYADEGAHFPEQVDLLVKIERFKGAFKSFVDLFVATTAKSACQEGRMALDFFLYEVQLCFQLTDSTLVC